MSDSNPFLKLLSQQAKSTESTKVQVPKSNMLLGPAKESIPEVVTSAQSTALASTGEIVVGSAYDLAHVNTESMDPKTTPETALALKVRAMDKKLTLDSAEDVRTLCDYVDVLIAQNPNLAGPPLFDLRNYVQQLMITLKEHPEFDDVIHDQDVHNIMKFVQATATDARDLRGVKTEKKAVRAAKKETSTLKGLDFKNAFDAIMGGGELKLPPK